VKPIPALIGLALVACTSAPSDSATGRYIVTTAPLPVRGVSPGICVAIDPTDPQGVWWWEPGRSGCVSRSTGPGVFRADHATVSASLQSGAIDVRFRLPLVRGPDSQTPEFADVSLVVEAGGKRAMASGALVPTDRRNDLELPEQPPGR
jgi:hypothetical protein